MVSQTLTTPLPLTWQHLGIMLLGRFVLNTAFRMVYPLLAFLAAGFTVDLRTASLLVTVQVGAMLISPLGGALADTRGERATMIWGLTLFCCGAAVCAITSSFGFFLLGYGLIGCGTALYHPSAQAYASARTDYARRGRVLGILELSWALAALVGVAGLTQLVQVNSAWAPAFWVLLAAGLLALALTVALLPETPRSRTFRSQDAQPISLAVLRYPSVAAGMLFLLCVMCGVEMIFVVYAGWLEADFGATTEQLGQVFGLLGIAEVVGSLGSALLVDHFGKQRMVLAGFIATALTQAALPFSAGNWLLFIPLFLLFMLCFEFAIVSTFPLISGLAPHARGTVLAFSVACIGLGRVIGSLVGPVVWLRFGFFANGLLACSLALIGVVICRLWIREGEQEHEHQ